MVGSPGLVLVAAMSALASGCALGSASPTHGVSATAGGAARRPDAAVVARLATYRGHGIAFRYPAAWRYRRRGVYSHMTSPVVDLASQPTRNPCTHRGCWFPARRLRPGAVVVIWDQGGGLILPSHPPAVGVRVRVLPRGCRALGGDEELTAQVVLPGGRVYQAEACLRGPDLAIHEREVRAMLASARRAS
jgi:hypothetical protein